MLASETVVCKNVETIALDSSNNRIVIVSPDGNLFMEDGNLCMEDDPEKILDLNQAVESISQTKAIKGAEKIRWTAVGAYKG